MPVRDNAQESGLADQQVKKEFVSNEASEKSDKGFTKQGKIIISLIVVVIVALFVLIAVVLTKDGESHDESRSEPQTTKTSEKAQSDQAKAPVIDLATIGMNTVHEAPVPDPPDAWGDYSLSDHWVGQLRVFNHSDQPSEPQGKDGANWVSSANGCGSVTYLITFKAVNEKAKLHAQLVNFPGETVSEGTMRDGWMLFTNCITPGFSLKEISGASTLSDVAYDVYEYTQSSVAQPVGTPAASSQPEESSYEAPVAEPTFVECVDGLTTMAIFSDGSQRPSDRCVEQHQQALKGERWCGGMYAPPEADHDEFVALCGREPQYE